MTAVCGESRNPTRNISYEHARAVQRYAVSKSSSLTTVDPTQTEPVDAKPHKSALSLFFEREDINFVITNRIPRRWLTRFMAWFSRIELAPIPQLSIAAWKIFSQLELEDAAPQHYRSMHDLFIRKLKPGTRPIDPDEQLFVSPCDGILGAHGRIEQGRALQIKGQSYSIAQLLGDEQASQAHIAASYLTIRIPSTMYHRFHAPCDAKISRVDYIPGDAYNVNPPALKRVESLYCKNERAVVHMHSRVDGVDFTMVPVGAILVASVRLHCLDRSFRVGRPGPETFVCSSDYGKGEELGWFQHGSTIVLLLPPSVELLPQLRVGQVLRVGRAIARFKTQPDARDHQRPNAIADGF